MTLTQSAAEEFRKMDYSLNGAKTGDTVTLCGTPWTVVGFTDGPAALLSRRGHDPHPVNCRTHHTVVLGSDHAAEFKPKPDRAAELADEFQSWFCHSGQTLNETSIAADTAKAAFSWLLTEKGAKL